MLQALCLTLLVLVLPCAGQLNYQERALYLGEGDKSATMERIVIASIWRSTSMDPSY